MALKSNITLYDDSKALEMQRCKKVKFDFTGLELLVKRRSFSVFFDTLNLILSHILCLMKQENSVYVHRTDIRIQSKSFHPMKSIFAGSSIYILCIRMDFNRPRGIFLHTLPKIIAYQSHYDAFSAKNQKDSFIVIP